MGDGAESCMRARDLELAWEGADQATLSGMSLSGQGRGVSLRESLESEKNLRS